MHAIKDEAMRNKVKKDNKLLANKVEKLFKWLIITVLGESFKKEFVRQKSPKKKR
jgi:hypothetical protein